MLKPEEVEEKKKLYRQALSMVFSKGIADKSKIVYWKNEHGETFWVNRAFSTDKGLMLSPTGFKPFSPVEFDAEIQKLFNQAKEVELKMAGER
jgi:hypothetical protein